MGLGRWGRRAWLQGHKFLLRGSCLLLPAVPATLSLDSWLQMPGDTLNLTLLTNRETTNLNWFLWPTGSPSPILLQAGTCVSLTSSRGQTVLSIVNISHRWAGSPPVAPSSSPAFSLLPFFLLSSSSPPLQLLLLPLFSFLLVFPPLHFPSLRLYILGKRRLRGPWM